VSGSAQVVVEELTGSGELETLRPLWLALHRHHRDVQPETPLQRDDEASWSARSGTYRRWAKEGSAVILAASLDGEVVGYAVAHLIPGADDDTFDFGATYAELYTLSVLPGRRSRGVGSRLLEELDEVLRARSVRTITVAAMASNSRAIEFYRRRGFTPLEVTFHRPVPSQP
jgi:ribosomal protein S18 acetylase RimI-like enzyme